MDFQLLYGPLPEPSAVYVENPHFKAVPFILATFYGKWSFDVGDIPCVEYTDGHGQKATYYHRNGRWHLGGN